MTAGICGILVTNPIWMAKVRIQIQDINTINGYNGLCDCIYRVIKEEGIHKLYRGLIPACFMVVNPALQFMFYEKLKYFLRYAYIHSNNNNNQNVINDDIIFKSWHFLAMGNLFLKFVLCVCVFFF